ncbi:MAG: hypothetical protein ABSD20_00160 [Terriglobales bacterium]|jgi:N-acetylmuramic acid 6-phosphate etherase
MKSIQDLGTERPNPSSLHLDAMTALEIAALMNREDAKIAASVKKALPQIAAAIGTRPETVQYVIAGGAKALGVAVETDEDSAVQGHRDLAAKRPGKRDVLAGIAASGRTPYTIATLEYARRRGAARIAVV